jgi:hypothetical protein
VRRRVRRANPSARSRTLADERRDFRAQQASRITSQKQNLRDNYIRDPNTGKLRRRRYPSEYGVHASQPKSKLKGKHPLYEKVFNVLHGGSETSPNGATLRRVPAGNPKVAGDEFVIDGGGVHVSVPATDYDSATLAFERADRAMARRKRRKRRFGQATADAMGSSQDLRPEPLAAGTRRSAGRGAFDAGSI